MAHHPLGGAAKQDVLEPGIAVCRHNDQVRFGRFDRLVDLRVRDSIPDFECGFESLKCPHLKCADFARNHLTHAGCVELNIRILGAPVGPIGVVNDIHHMDKMDARSGDACERLCILESRFSGFGEVNRHEDFPNTDGCCSVLIWGC